MTWANVAWRLLSLPGDSSARRCRRVPCVSRRGRLPINLAAARDYGQHAFMNDSVDQLTELLRVSDDLFWRSLRAALVSQGVDPDRSHLAASSEEGDDCEFGVLVTEAGAVVQFVWQPSLSSFMEWTPITSWWPDSPYRREVEAAMRRRSLSG
jgi:hypothetical protein